MTLADKMIRHKKRILDVMRRTEIDAIRNPHLRFTVYVGDDDGMPIVLQDVAGGNNFYRDCLPVYDVCYQCSGDVIYLWTDSHGVHPYAMIRDNLKIFEEIWEEHFLCAVQEARKIDG